MFLAQALLLSALGGTFGGALGAAVTGLMAAANRRPFTLPLKALVIGIGSDFAHRSARWVVPGDQSRSYPTDGSTERVGEMSNSPAGPRQIRNTECPLQPP
jgi:hypothetical protein